MSKQRVVYFVMCGHSYEGVCPAGIVDSIEAIKTCDAPKSEDCPGGCDWIEGLKIVITDDAVVWDVDGDVRFDVKLGVFQI